MRSLSRRELRAALVSRKPDDHKGVFGHVLIAAGSRGMSGAAVLAGRAALRSGAGLVTIAVPEEIQPIVAAQAPEAMTVGLPKNPLAALKALKSRRYTVLAIGPGLSAQPHAAGLVRLLLAGLPLPAVIDADALNILAARDPGEARRLMRGRARPCVLTPHPGELARCLRLGVRDVQADRQGCVERLARQWSGTTLLKGSETLISDGKRTVLNRSGGPGLAKGGTGDALTGLIAGLWAQSLAGGRVEEDAGFQAAALGAWLHGRAGEAAQKAKTGWAMTAGDVIESLPEAFKILCGNSHLT